MVVYTSTDPETWTRTMDWVMRDDAEETAVRLRWKTSKNGGRSIATPTAAPQALAASRRRGNAPVSLQDYAMDIMCLHRWGVRRVNYHWSYYV